VLLVAILAFLLFRALTADDGTHGVRSGQCVATVEGGDFSVVDCGDSTAVGVVTLVQRNVFTDPASVKALCARHGALRGFTSATSDGGAGTVICVADPR
jgi:hypothetical protein